MTCKYPKYKSTSTHWIGDIPSQWELLPGLAVIQENKSKNSGLIETQVLSLSYGRIVVKPIDKLHGLIPESFETYQIVDPGEIIIRPTDLQNDKKSLRVGQVKNRGIITSAYISLKPKHPGIEDFLFRLFQAYDFMKVFYGLGSGLRQNMGFNDLRRLPILLPPLNEQILITKYLNQVETKIAHLLQKKKRLITLLKEQKQAIINQAVTKGLDPNVRLKSSGIEWIGDIPEHWEIRKVTHLFKQIGSGTTPDSVNTTYYNGPYSWIISGDLNDSHLCKTSRSLSEKAIFTYSTLKIYPENSLVIAMYGATIGKVALTKIKACTNQACCVLSHPIDTINMEYMLLLFLKIKPYLIRIGYGGGQPNINQDTLRSLRIPIPPLEEQCRIVDTISSQIAKFNQIITDADKQIDLIQEYRTRLISDVVTGKIDIRNIKIDKSDDADIHDNLIDIEELDEESLDLVGTDNENN